jgi:cytidylate kinase
MRIAISGRSGCGNTTVSTLVSQITGYPLINFTFRNLAEERGVDFWTLSRMAEEDDSIDLELDRRQVEMALEQKSCVLGSRLAIWVLKEADLKVYLEASLEVRVARIHRREGGSLEERLKETRQRDLNDTERYKRIYSIDNTQSDVADLVINTDNLNAQEIAALIVEAASSRQK